ncbi:hypothetical protein D4R51_03365 [bacterium]|nr:MAG: hypothetical protein D4R51_03365 [bacterium]
MAGFENRGGLIKYVEKLGVSGVEITLGHKEEISAFKISDKAKKWLKSLDYVSIHAPFRLLEEAKDQNEVISQLDAISKLYKEVNAKNVIIHPDNLPSTKILEKYDFNISTENLTPKSRMGISQMKKIFRKYPKIKLCLDVSHAYLWSELETKRIVDNFGDKISQIHFSGTYRKKDHQSLRSVTKNFLRSIEPIKNLQVPIVIEEDIEKEKGERYLVEEVEYIKAMF